LTALVQFDCENILFEYNLVYRPAYAYCTDSDSEHALASDIRKPITQRAQVYHTKITNACQW